VEKRQSRVAVAEARKQFRNPKEGKHVPLEAVTKREIQTMINNTSMCSDLYSVVTHCSIKCSLNQITNPNTVCSHS
jgi:hypothetical protein